MDKKTFHYSSYSIFMLLFMIQSAHTTQPCTGAGKGIARDVVHGL
jgi:hypothetical protein